MAIPYENFLRKFSIRVQSQLIKPPLIPLELLDLPKQSVLHFIPDSALVKGPDNDEYIFRHIKTPIMLGHITENGDTKGLPKRIIQDPSGTISRYHQFHRRFRLMKNYLAASRDPNALIVYNYGLIGSLYRYQRSLYSEYNRWWNTQSAVWKNIAQLTDTNDREHFILCTLPPVLPSITDLRLGSLPNLTQKTIKIFNNPESLMILELWKWFGKDREDSIISHVPEGKLGLVNFIYQESGRWFTLNLGKVNAWRQATEDELEENAEANDTGAKPYQMQLYFLRLMMALFQVRTSAAPEVKDAVDAEASKELKAEGDTKPTDSEPMKAFIQKPSLPKKDLITGLISATGETEEINQQETFTHPEEHLPDTTKDTFIHDEALEKQLMADLAELEKISLRYVETQVHLPRFEDEEKETVEIKTSTTKEVEHLEDGVLRVCDTLAETGLLSAAEYRRYKTLAESYKTIVAPDGKTTLEHFIKIEPEALKIDEAQTTIPDRATIIDKTMLTSSLQVFDQKYIKEVMPRDVASMVMNVQKAGIAVTSYEVERIDDVLGQYDMYTVRAVPVDGAASTFRFKLPVVKENGTYESNGSRYRMRKQWAD